MTQEYRMTTVNHSQELTKESPQIKQSLGLSGNEIYQLAASLLREKKSFWLISRFLEQGKAVFYKCFLLNLIRLVEST